MDFLTKVTKYRIKRFALVFSALIACSFFYLQSSPALLIKDAQSGIAVFFTLIKSSLFFVLLGLSTYKCLSARQTGNKITATTYLVITIALVSLAGNSMFDATVIKNALEDSANPKTAPERLRALAIFQTEHDYGYSYEINKRLAINPSTPVDVLESLYGHEGQIGMDMSLASNPNSPNYLLIELSTHPDELWRPHITEILARNPKVKDGTLFFDENMVLHEKHSQ